MLKYTFASSLIFVPAFLAGCGSSNSTTGASGGGSSGEAGEQSNAGRSSVAGHAGSSSEGGASMGEAGQSANGEAGEAGNAAGNAGASGASAGSSGAGAGGALAGTGGSSSGAGGVGVGGSSAGAGGASAGAGGSSGGTGGTPGCTTNGDCKASGTICETTSGQCVACGSNSDCKSDTTNYGATFICDLNQGQCVVGNCLTDTDCVTPGQICGLSQPDTCAPCTTDSQCQGDAKYGAGTLCSAGACVSPTCSAAKTSCTLTAGNTSLAGHECCAAASGDACVAGGCCDSTQCASLQACVGNICTSCDSVAAAGGSTVYYVDPTNGSDANATGSGTSAGQAAANCAFKTITRALQVVGNPTQASGVVIKVKGNDDPAVSGEVFPITVPQYVVIQGATGAVTLNVPTGKGGFNIAGTGSTLKNLIVEGGGVSGIGVKIATSGVFATLDAVTVQDTASSGIELTAGTLTLLSGTTIQKAGTTQARQQGVTVGGTGKLIANISSGQVSISNNTAQGISVGGGGSIDIEGIVTATVGTPTSYAGTVAINNNYFAQVYIDQTGATPPTNTIKGILATGSATTHGLRVFAGSNVYVRKSVFVGNGLNGIYLSHTGTRANGASAVGNVDLGKTTDPGLNVVQGPNGQLTNGGGGICISLNPTQAQTVNAEGNIFSVGDCSAAAATLTKHMGACGPVAGKPDDIGFEWLTGANTTQVTVDATKCN